MKPSLCIVSVTMYAFYLKFMTPMKDLFRAGNILNFKVIWVFFSLSFTFFFSYYLYIYLYLSYAFSLSTEVNSLKKLPRKNRLCSPQILRQILTAKII